MELLETSIDTFRNFWIKPLIRFSILFLVIVPASLTGLSCGSETRILPGPKPVVTQEPKQFDVPFANVPTASEVVMYEVNLWAFSQQANLDGVTEKLADLKNLGVNVVWLMPVYEIGEVRGIGSPYAVKDYNAINSSFGTLDDLRSLVKEAHALDMAVMLDWVANHTAWDHAWIRNSTWYTRDESGNIVNPPGTNWNDVADLNFESSAMRNEMIRAMKYWVLEANVDGLRCDYADGVPADFWKQAIDSLRALPDRELIMFAEGANKELFEAGFDLIFGWNFYSKLKDVYTNNTSVDNVISAHTADYAGVAGDKHILRWISNHDESAWEDSAVDIFKGQDGALAAFVATAFLGGVPLIYNGQEVGFESQLAFFQNSSTKIDWEANPDVLDQYRKLIAVRKDVSVALGGELETFHTADVMAFSKKSGDDAVMVLVNLRNAAQDFALPASIANTEWTNAMTGENIIVGNNLAMAAYEYLILRN